MKKDLIEGLIKNEVRKAKIDLTLDILEIEGREDIDFDTKMKKIRKLFKNYGYNTKETNRRIRNKEDWYMEDQTENKVAIFKDGKVLVSFTAEEFNYLSEIVNDLVWAEDELVELRKSEKKIKGWAYGSLTDSLEMDIFERGRDRVTRYKKRLAKSILDEIKYNYNVKEEDGLYIVEEIYKFKHMDTAIGII